VSKTPVEWLLVLFKLLAASGAGVLAFVGISEFLGGRKRTNLIAIIIALVMIVVGGGLAVLKVGNPSSVMAAAANIRTGAPVSLEFLACGLTLVVGVIYLFVQRQEGPASKVLGCASVLGAVAVGYTTGYSHQAMVGTPVWNTPAIPFGFLFGALLLGGFIYLALSARDGTDGLSKVFVWIVAGLAVLTTLVTGVHGFAAPLDDRLFLYLALTPLVGGVGSLLAAVLYARSASLVWAALGILTAVVGGLAFRAFVWVIVKPGLLSFLDTSAYGQFFS
jgi:hypothetical protein